MPHAVADWLPDGDAVADWSRAVAHRAYTAADRSRECAARGTVAVPHAPANPSYADTNRDTPANRLTCAVCTKPGAHTAMLTERGHGRGRGHRPYNSGLRPVTLTVDLAGSYHAG